MEHDAAMNEMETTASMPETDLDDMAVSEPEDALPRMTLEELPETVRAGLSLIHISEPTSPY